MTVVVDASVVVSALASADATGKWAESVLAGEPLAAPHLMPVEAASSGTDHPAETLDYSYEQQVEMLQQESDRRDDQARAALAQGREDLALAALQHKAGLQGQLSDLQGQYASLEAVRRGAADCDTAAKRVKLTARP
jgi:hypothetical protein